MSNLGNNPLASSNQQGTKKPPLKYARAIRSSQIYGQLIDQTPGYRKSLLELFKLSYINNS